jgi:hypothetical protein
MVCNATFDCDIIFIISISAFEINHLFNEYGILLGGRQLFGINNTFILFLLNIADPKCHSNPG